MASGNSTYHCIVCTLTKIPFASLGKDSQHRIVKAGRPPNTISVLFPNFNVLPWMTQCDKSQKLYCWPCLLFNTSDFDTWGKRGFSDFNRLAAATIEHTKEVSHQAKSKTLKLWMDTYSDGSDDSSEEELHCIPELDFLNSNDSVEEELDVKPNVESLNASSSSSSQQTVKAILDLCDPAGVKEIEIPGSSPIIVRDNSPEPDMNVNEQNMGETDSQTSGSCAEKYQLKWHSHQQNLNSSISCLYKNDRYADVTLITCNSDENFTILAHKLVLGTSSTYFANIFDRSSIPSNAMMYIVLPPEITKRAIQTLIQYMYTGESTVSVDILNEVLRSGDILKIRGLWRNQTEASANSEQHSSKDAADARHRSERISVDRIPLQEPRIAQNPIHDSPVIVTNMTKSHGISQTAQTAASSSAPLINVNKHVAIDPGDRGGKVQNQKRPFQETNQQACRQLSATKISAVKPSSSNVESTYATGSGQHAMPEELNFLNVKEEPVEWADVNAEEISIEKSDMPMVKVEIRETGSAEGQDGQEQVYSPLTCELCSETFTVPAEWVRHIESHTDPPHTVSKRRRRVENDNDSDATAALKCDLCAMYFVTPAEWVRHVQSTHTETELAISNNSSLTRRCFKSTTSDPQSLSAAQQQEKSCSVCKKSFPSYASMLIHKRTHTGERPFYCDICNKGFNVKSNLLRHMRTLHNQHGSQSPVSGDSHGSD
ncbi:GDNF-inducible zinc finger protein 1 isoform X3 [Armigeres subalbatus]|uniref:GDNF-inducible zinc finger protein 1 isoform X3 n=1 Tax=Armigeres subalbatus TaxID=124917 RepID=UPI002ED699E3